MVYNNLYITSIKMVMTGGWFIIVLPIISFRWWLKKQRHWQEIGMIYCEHIHAYGACIGWHLLQAWFCVPGATTGQAVTSEVACLREHPWLAVWVVWDPWTGIVAQKVTARFFGILPEILFQSKLHRHIQPFFWVQREPVITVEPGHLSSDRHGRISWVLSDYPLVT